MNKTSNPLIQEVYSGLVWDDFSFPVTNLKINPATSKPDYDQDENEFLFDANSTERVVGSAITSHKFKLGFEGMTWRPHIHWIQENAGRVLWQLEYKIWAANTLEPIWTTILSTDDLFSYNSSSLHQITIFPYIDASTFNSTAYIVKVRVSRLGDHILDTYSGDARFEAFDIHVPIDSVGSKQVFNKYI